MLNDPYLDGPFPFGPVDIMAESSGYPNAKFSTTLFVFSQAEHKQNKNPQIIT